jgi:hypothetical protein
MASWFKDKNSISFSGEIDELANAINEQSSEEKRMVSICI